MRISAAARRYSRALFGLAKDEDRIAEIGNELKEFADVLATHEEIRNALFRPLHPVAERRAVLNQLSDRIGVSATVRNFFAFLVDQRRLVDFDGIRTEYERLADTAAGRTRADVVTAAPLSEEQRDQLRRARQDVELDVSVDASLLGGAIASVGALVFDGSLRTQLTQLRASLTKGQ
jgi:F-type H+-transporting ATPase subunit delta